MKRMKLSEAELIAVIVNMRKELDVVFEMLPKKAQDIEDMKEQILSNIDELLFDGLKVSPKDNLYEAVFGKSSEKVSKTS